MSELYHTPLHSRHVALAAKMVDFAGWDMPVQYPSGIVAEHLATRKTAGLFDVSHMGRLVVRGPGAMGFLQHVLTNNAASLAELTSQYTIIANAAGGAVDDAYLCRFCTDEFLLVVNASNREKDLSHFRAALAEAGDKFGPVDIVDRTGETAMLALQGPASQKMLQAVVESGCLPAPVRNALSIVTICGAQVQFSRTGYTGEPLCFELFMPADSAPAIWDALIARGAAPVGLGARDTLRLEASLPLYGHELGTDADGHEIPIFACPLAKFAVSFSPLKDDFIGRAALARQSDALTQIAAGNCDDLADLPRRIRPISLLARGVARQGAKVYRAGKHVGYVTSGTMLPQWNAEPAGPASQLGNDYQLRAVALALIDSDILDGEPIEVEIRGKRIAAVVTSPHPQPNTPSSPTSQGRQRDP